MIAPGLTCPSNAFFERALAETGSDHLYITSANRSRHLTGAAEEPAHWKAGALAADFAHLDDLVVLAHRDEVAARAAYPAYLTTSVTLLSFHAPEGDLEEPPVLTVDRHGSLHLDDVRRAAAPLGLQVRLPAAPSSGCGSGVRRGAGVSDYRIGLVVPSSNTTMETEIPAMLRRRESVDPTVRFTTTAVGYDCAR
ncbi:hypothetical protein NKG94_10355 [Micromonospora sp. M12]